MADDPIQDHIESGNLPTVLTSAGLVPTPPLDLLNRLIEIVARTNPGYTATLPGTLIEDIASTDTQAMVLVDQARVEALNSLTPFGCNEFVLMLLGKVYGVTIGQPTNTSVSVVFVGLPGFVIGKGFIVGDGTFQYIAQDGGIIGTDGRSQPIYCVSPTSGAWAVPTGSVTQLVTQPPTGFTLAVTNSLPGVPAIMAETATQYRSRVLRAGLAASQGMARYLRTLLSNVPGVQGRLIGIRQIIDGGGWMVMVGGGDPYEVAYAIYQALFDISSLVGSVLRVTGITNSNPATAATDLNHNLVPGDNIVYENADPAAFNGIYAVVATPTGKSFTFGKRYAPNPIANATWAGGVLTLTTLDPHGLTTGSVVKISGFVPDAYNVTGIATVTTTFAFTVPLASNPGTDTTLGILQAGIANFDSSQMAPYTGGGIILPNPRNMDVTITDYPDTYLIRYVRPPLQTVKTAVRWNTNSPNYVNPVAISQAAAQPLADYINSIIVGAPINLLQMQDTFQDSILALLQPAYLSRLVFEVSINNVLTAPLAGTQIIEGDPESYFFAEAADFSIVQG